MHGIEREGKNGSGSSLSCKDADIERKRESASKVENLAVVAGESCREDRRSPRAAEKLTKGGSYSSTPLKGFGALESE